MPGGLIVLAAVLCVPALGLPDAVPPVARFAPPALLIIGAILGLRFQDSQPRRRRAGRAGAPTARARQRSFDSGAVRAAPRASAKARFPAAFRWLSRS